MKMVLLLILLSFSSFATDLTSSFESHYMKDKVLSRADIQKLSESQIVLIPGIVSESFIWSDTRGVFDFSLLFKDYFGAQLKHYKNLKLDVTRLKASSKSVQETALELDKKFSELKKKNKKAYFITHSLGGLVLLDYLANNQVQDLVAGIVFIQSPFYGAPVASIYFENPYYARTLLGPIIPFFNTSEETIRYLSLDERQKRMEETEGNLSGILRNIPVVTSGGLALNYKSLFRPSLNIMGYGCITFLNGSCYSRTLYPGPYEDSDGMVPFSSTLLPHVDSVKLRGVDHGETVLNLPYETLKRTRLTDALLKLIL